MDGDLMVQPVCGDDAIVGSVIAAASSRGDHEEVYEHAGGVTIRRFVSYTHYSDTGASLSKLWLKQLRFDMTLWFIVRKNLWFDLNFVPNANHIIPKACD